MSGVKGAVLLKFIEAQKAAAEHKSGRTSELMVSFILSFGGSLSSTQNRQAGALHTVTWFAPHKRG